MANGHRPSAVFVHQTRDLGLHCDGCRWSGGSFRDRAGRDERIAAKWQAHLDRVATGAVIKHGKPANVDQGICKCVTCMIAWRKVQA